MQLPRSSGGGDSVREVIAGRLGFRQPSPQKGTVPHGKLVRGQTGLQLSPEGFADAPKLGFPSPDEWEGFPGNGLVVDPALGHPSGSTKSWLREGLKNRGITVRQSRDRAGKGTKPTKDAGHGFSSTPSRGLPTPPEPSTTPWDEMTWRMPTVYAQGSAFTVETNDIEEAQEAARARSPLRPSAGRSAGTYWHLRPAGRDAAAIRPL